MSTDQYYDRDVQRTFSEPEREQGFFGAEDDVNELSRSPCPNEINSSPRRPSPVGANRERKRRSVSDNLEKAKGKRTKKGRRTLDSGQSSASQPREPQRREADIKELVEKKSLLEVVKVLNDRVDRRIKNEKMADMESIIFVSSMAEKFLGAGVDLNLIQRQWPVRSDLTNIKKEIRKTSEEIKDNEGAGLEGTDEMKQRLVDIGEKIKNYDKRKRGDSTKVKDLEKLFTDEGTRLETLKEKFFTAFPWLMEGEIVAPTREQLQSQLFAMDNNKVEVEHFPGLKEALEKSYGQWNVPSYLEPNAIEIQMVRGTTESAHIRIQLLVCAAIHEMKHLQIGYLDWPTLLRWGATLNKAAQLGFYVEFAENLLMKNLFVFFERFKIR